VVATYREALHMSRIGREMICLMEGRHVHASAIYAGGVGTVATPDAAREMALEASKRLHPGLALGLFALEISGRDRGQPRLVDGQPVQREVQLTVAAPVQAITSSSRIVSRAGTAVARRTSAKQSLSPGPPSL
jgi:hypothetical protein